MSGEITLVLPDDIMQRAERLAERTGRGLPELLVETIELSLRPLGVASEPSIPTASISDEEVLANTEIAMPPAQDARLSELLQRQQARQLTDSERGELTALMDVYQQLLLRKAEFLREAVHRGLREPLES